MISEMSASFFAGGVNSHFGFPAFAAVAAIFWLMIAKPEIALF